MESEEEKAAPRGRGLFREPWLLGAGLCALAAAACLVLGLYDAAFVAGALGAVAWFLNYRAKLPPRPDTEPDGEDDDEELEEGTAEDGVRRD